MITDEEIEQVAKEMCQECALVPDHYSYNLIYLTQRSVETKEVPLKSRPAVHNPGVAPSYYIANQYRELDWTEELTHAPNWKFFIRDAERAIAGWRAVHKWALISG